jgi:heme-degrading monooxygenase HmoA
VAHARVGIYKVRPETAEAVLAKGKQELPDLMRGSPGFQRYGVLRTAPDEVVSLSSWDSREQADGAAERLTAWVRQNGADSFVGAENHVGEIAISAQSSDEAATHGRVAVYKFKPGAVDQVIEKARSGFLPLLQGQPGFVRYVVVNTADDTGVSYSGWRSKEQADAAVASAAHWVEQNLADLVVSVENHVGEMLWSARR